MPQTPSPSFFYDWISDCSRLYLQHKPVDVLIIGARASCLAAAGALIRAGFQTAILEARDRIGGRVHTVRTESIPVPVELGAEFILFLSFVDRFASCEGLPDEPRKPAIGYVEDFNAAKASEIKLVYSR